MRPTVATVLSPRPWEPRFVDTAVDTALVRLVARCYDPVDLPPVDVVIVGTETPWLNARHVARWHAAGITVIGIFPATDRAAVELLCRAGVDQLFAETAEPVLILRAARDLAARRACAQRSNPIAAPS